MSFDSFGCIIMREKKGDPTSAKHHYLSFHILLRKRYATSSFSHFKNRTAIQMPVSQTSPLAKLKGLSITLFIFFICQHQRGVGSGIEDTGEAWSFRVGK